jgi:hypothetical protein
MNANESRTPGYAAEAWTEATEIGSKCKNRATLVSVGLKNYIFLAGWGMNVYFSIYDLKTNHKYLYKNGTFIM